MSARPSTFGLLIACSGAMKSAVPTTAPWSSNSVSLSLSLVERARPMSRIFTAPNRSRITLPGLMSR